MVKSTLLRRELKEIPLEDMVTEATLCDGVAHRKGVLFSGTLDCLVLLVVGPAVEQWSDAVSEYHRVMGEPSNGQDTSSGQETDNSDRQDQAGAAT